MVRVMPLLFYLSCVCFIVFSVSYLPIPLNVLEGFWGILYALSVLMIVCHLMFYILIELGIIKEETERP